MKLPLNCEVEYIAGFLDFKEAQDLFLELSDVVNQTFFHLPSEKGKRVDFNFGKVMFVDQNLLDENRFSEEHWGITMGWFGSLKKLKDKIEKFTNNEFQTCVLIYYPDGNSGVDFHSDYSAFGDTTLIPSISLGEAREFKFREKESRIEFTQLLTDGSLIIMGKHCQERYDHSLPLNHNCKKPRINLTFRKFGFDN